MKKLLVLLFVLVCLPVHSNTGHGEYRFGPDLSENFACDIARQRAMEDLVLKQSGELIDRIIEQNCENEECLTQRQFFSHMEAYVRSFIERSREVETRYGYRVCKVSVTGDVRKKATDVNFIVNGSFTRSHNERFTFNVTTNKPRGDLFVFNLYNDKYKKVYVARQLKGFDETKVPYKGSFRAVLPEGQQLSQEMFLFLFVTNEVNVKDEFTISEMNLFLASLDPSTRKAYRRFLTIRM